MAAPATATADPAAAIAELEKQIGKINTEIDRLNALIVDKTAKRNTAGITTKAYNELAAFIKARTTEVEAEKKSLAELTKRKGELEKGAIPAVTVATKPSSTASSPVTLDTIDRKVKEAHQKVELIVTKLDGYKAQRRDLGAGMTPSLMAKHLDLLEKWQAADLEKDTTQEVLNQLFAIQQYARVYKGLTSTDTFKAYKKVRDAFKAAEAADKPR